MGQGYSGEEGGESISVGGCSGGGGSNSFQLRTGCFFDNPPQIFNFLLLPLSSVMKQNKFEKNDG